MNRLIQARVARTLVAGWLAAAAAGCGAPEPPAPRRPAPTGPPDVWLITLDTFRADRAGAWGNPHGLTPALDRLLRTGSMWREAYTPAPLTAPSHASMLTGLEPPHHGVRDNGREAIDAAVPTLATLLHDEGFATGGFIAAFPLIARFGFGQGFDVFNEELRGSRTSSDYYTERPASDVVDAALAWVGSVDPDTRWLLWTHFFDAHFPLLPPDPLSSLPGVGDYDREIRALDVEIRRLARGLESMGGGRLPVTAIVSDHGEGMGDHRESSHGILLHETTMRAVLGIASPPGSAEAIRTPAGIRPGIAGHADLLPTLLDVLGVPSEGFDGRSLLAAGSGEPGSYGETWYPALHFGWSPLHSWRDTRWTYVEGPAPQLFDRRSDPGEKRDVIADHTDVAAAFSERIAELARDPEARVRSLASADRERLEALGYASAGAELRYDPDKDPRKYVAVTASLFRGIDLANEGRAAEALEWLRRAYARDPGNPLTMFHLADALRASGDPASAMDYYRRVISISPQAAEAWAHLALLESERGRTEEAFSLLEQGLLHGPDSFALLMTAGELHAEHGRPDEARGFYRRAGESEPGRPEPWSRLAALAEARGDHDEAARLREQAERATAHEGS